MLFFIDANVLIYTRDYRDSRKQRAAASWMAQLAARELAVVNLQVLNEVCHVALRKLTHLEPGDIRGWVHDLRAFGDTVIDTDMVEEAWSVHERYKLSWFDCILLSAAERLGCSHFLTEDMGANRTIGPLALVNPFATPPDAILTT